MYLDSHSTSFSFYFDTNDFQELGMLRALILIIFLQQGEFPIVGLPVTPFLPMFTVFMSCFSWQRQIRTCTKTSHWSCPSGGSTRSLRPSLRPSTWTQTNWRWSANRNLKGTKSTWVGLYLSRLQLFFWIWGDVVLWVSLFRANKFSQADRKGHSRGGNWPSAIIFGLVIDNRLYELHIWQNEGKVVLSVKAKLFTIKPAHNGQIRSQTKSNVRSRWSLRATVTYEIIFIFMDRMKKKSIWWKHSRLELSTYIM